MATAGGARRHAPPPWHERLQAGVADVERAAAALLAVCEEPEAQAALEVRARATRGRRAAQRTRALFLRIRWCASASVSR